MSGLTDILQSVTDLFGQRPATTNEDVARAMVMLQSPLTRPAGNDPVSQEARRKAVWANAANVTPDEVRKSGLLHYGMTPERYEQAMMWAGLAPMNATVFHGSPYRFNRFDASKIGTGQGAQSYGHGHYLADQQAVAKDIIHQTAPINWAGLSKDQNLLTKLQEASEVGIGPSDAIAQVRKNLQFQRQSALKNGDMAWFSKVADQEHELARLEKLKPSQGEECDPCSKPAEPGFFLKK